MTTPLVLEKTYAKGALIRTHATFTDDSGAAIDPGGVMFWCVLPDGTTRSYTSGTDAELVKDGVGLYHIDLSLDQSGTWYYGFVGTGAGQSADEFRFNVKRSYRP